MYATIQYDYFEWNGNNKAHTHKELERFKERKGFQNTRKWWHETKNTSDLFPNCADENWMND